MTSVVIVGGTGQLGTELLRLDWGADVKLLAPTRSELDLGAPDTVRDWFAANPVDAIICTAAYTAVDRAQDDTAAAFAANAYGPAALADIARNADIPLLHVSTDYVFSGAGDGFYHEEDPVGPLSVYGASKLAGEYAVLLGNPRSIVVRTAWVLSAHGNNFLKTMRRLSQTRSEVSVVADQIGCPTSAADIAAAIRVIIDAHLADRNAPCGVYHFVNAGAASWCELAAAIFALDGSATRAVPIPTSGYPTPAPRPANSRLSTAKVKRDFGVVPRPWHDAVSDIVCELRHDEKKERL